MKNRITISLIAVLIFILKAGTGYSFVSGCSDAGTASATQDSICVGSSTALLLTLYTGSIQWQSYDGATWNDETGAGSTSDNYIVSPSATTDYRAVVTAIGCNPDTSNVVTIVVGVPAPTTTGATRCGYGQVTLNAVGSGIKWYDAPTGGVPLFSGSSYTTNVGATTTFYAAATSNGGGSGTAPMPAEATTFTSIARGYWFTSPSDFNITGLFIPGSNGPTQNIAVIRFNPAVPPPFFATTTNAFTTLFLTQNDPSAGVIPCYIQIFAGDVIGILGTRGTNDVNSYAPSPNTTVIDGQTITISRMGMQFPLATVAPQEIWQEAGGSISRVEITYEVGCESSRTPAVATITPAPAITLTATPAALCAGETSTLNVTSSNPSYNYTWSPPTGLSGTTGSTVTATPMVPITYTVVADDGTCGAIDSVFMSVGPASVAGTATISTDTLCAGSSATLFLNGNTGNIQWQYWDGSAWVNETGPGSTTNQYEVTPMAYTQYQAIVTSGGCDPDTSGIVSVEVLTITDPITFNDTICGPGTVTLSATGQGVMNWFTAPTGGVSINTANNYNPTISTTTTYYVEASAGGSFNVGPASGGIGSQTPLAGNDYGLQFDVIQQATIERVYVSPEIQSGNITINLRDALGGPILNTITASVTAFSGLVPINLGFTVNPGTYRLELQSGSVPLYYNTNGAVYPYTTPACPITITGFVNPNFGTGGQFYFFYNWEVTEGCKSNRVPVTGFVLPAPPVPTITSFGNQLQSSSATNNQWYLNGIIIPGATLQLYTPTQPGSYTVVVTDPSNGCTSESTPAIVTGIQDINSTGSGIYMFPNPVTDQITIEFSNPVSSGTILNIYNTLGQNVKSVEINSQKMIIELDVEPGMYKVEVKSESGIYAGKVMKL